MDKFRFSNTLYLAGIEAYLRTQIGSAEIKKILAHFIHEPHLTI